MSILLRNWLGSLKWRFGEASRFLAYRLPLPGSKRFVRNLWDNQAEMIHRQWGELEHDYAILSKIFACYQPQSLIDVGCGSGRLFKLYTQHHIPRVVGVDISQQALEIARQRFPQIATKHGRLEDLHFAAKEFDLAVCNRVLQHVPPRMIQKVVTKLCATAKYIYINELTASDNLSENFYMVKHDYATLFRVESFAIQEEGQLGEQRYQLYTSQALPS